MIFDRYLELKNRYWGEVFPSANECDSLELMNKLAGTFYFWVIILSFLNTISFILAITTLSISTGDMFLFPVAWCLQLPLVIFLAVIHHGINSAIAPLPASTRKIMRLATASLVVFLCMLVYAGSQLMYLEINTFVSWDALKVGIENARQLLPDVKRNNATKLVFILICALVSGMLYTRRYNKPYSRHLPGSFSLVVFIILFLSSAGSFAFVYGSSNNATKRIRNNSLPSTYLTLSFIDNHLSSFGTEEVDAFTPPLQPQISLNDYLNHNQPSSTPNIFFIMLEAISWDHLGFTGYQRQNITPNIDNVASDSVFFTASYATANHSNYSQTSVHSSQYPLRKKYLDFFGNINYPKILLFDILHQAGYQTAFYSAQNEDWQGMKKFIFANTELEHFFHSKDELGENIGPESKLDDKLVRIRAQEYLNHRNPDQPVFFYINFQKTHFPYELGKDDPHPYQPCSTDHFKFQFFHYDQSHLVNVVNKYDNALHYMDAQVGEFINYLKQNNLYDNSLIVIAADHGEAFYQQGYPTHGTTLFDDQMRTFTLFKLPGRSKQLIRTDAISLIDINPTILEIIGMGNHPSFQGQQVLNKPREGYIYLLSHGMIKALGVVDFPWKYLVSSREGRRLVNVEKDRTESVDFSNLFPEKLKELKIALSKYYNQQLYYYTGISQEERDKYYPPRLYSRPGMVVQKR